MRLGLYLRYPLWEARGSGGRLLYFVVCLAIGVAAVVAVGSLSRSLDRTIRGEARELMAADLAVSSRRAIPAELDSILARVPGLTRADLREMVSIVAGPARAGGPGRSLLVELKVVDGPYPLYGDLVLEPDRPLEELLGPRGAVVAPELLSRLDIGLGDEIRVGGEPFTITGLVHAEPDRITDAFSLGPRVFLGLDGLARTRLVGTGSRLEFRTLIAVPESVDVSALAERIENELSESEYVRVETYAEGQPRLRRGLRRLEGYLGLLALLSLLVGGIGAAQAIQSWLAARLDSLAVLKCLGLRPRELLGLLLVQAVLLGLVASLLGAAVGIAVQQLLAGAFGDLIPPGFVDPWQPAAILRGIVLGTGVAVAFSLPTALAVLRIPPARVFRRQAEPLRTARLLPVATFVLLVFLVAALAALQSRSLELALEFTGGVLGTAALLALAALALTRAIGRVPRDFGNVWLRYGLAALARPGAATLGALVAFGLGLLVVLVIADVEANLSAQLTAELPENAPSLFLVDVQPDQWPGIQQLLADAGATEVTSAPVVMARLGAIDEVPVRELREQGGRRWPLTREQRLTYLEDLPADNRVVAGALWSEPDRAEVSLEEEYARELGVGLGSRLRFDLQGVPLELVVTSLRSVDWESFGINFFLVVEPGVLEEAPQFRLATARLPKSSDDTVRDALAAAYPNVTMLEIRQVLEKLMGLLVRLRLGVAFLAAFTVVAGLAILAGAVATSSLRRNREVALLKTLGMSRPEVLLAFTVEYSLVGLVAATIACAGGSVLAWVVVDRLLELDWTPHPELLALTLAGGSALAVLAGLLASTGAIRRRPVEVLRDE